MKWKGKDIETDKWMDRIRLRSPSEGWQRYEVQWNVNTVRWRSAGGISVRVCYFADNQRPGLKLTLERVDGRIVRGSETEERTSHCGYRPDNAVLARVTVLRNWYCGLLKAPAWVPQTLSRPYTRQIVFVLMIPPLTR